MSGKHPRRRRKRKRTQTALPKTTAPYEPFYGAMTNIAMPLPISAIHQRFQLLKSRSTANAR